MDDDDESLTTDKDSLAAAVETSLFAIAHGDEAWKSCVIGMIRKSILFRKEQITDNNSSKFHYDIEVRIAPALFRRFATFNKPHDASCWVILSPFGVERIVTSTTHLASLILPELERQCHDRNIGRHVRIDPKSNFIRIATISLEQRLQASGWLPCPQCPQWFRQSQNFWWHLQAQHATAHHEATETAMYHENRDSTALVLYEPNPRHHLQWNKTSMMVPSNARDIPRRDTVLTTMTPWDAVQSGSLERLKQSLAETTFDANTDRDRHGSLLIHWAAGGGFLEMTRYLVESLHCDACAKQVGNRSFEGRTPLHWAARNGHVKLVEYLLSIRCVHDHCDDSTADGTTAFCWAAWQGHQRVLELLWEAGCNVRLSNRFGCNASLWAAQGNSTAKTLAWLAKKGCSVVTVNNSRHGVFHKAAQRGNRQVCEWMLQYMDVDTFDWDLIGPDCDNATPSDLAGMEGHTELAHWLAHMEMTLVVRFSSILPPPKWLTPYSSEVGFEWEPGGGILRMRSIFTTK